uniref:CPG4 domain-containing protein n=1 Tax=Syphacia muris TaxID=451379 RepID=A0A0N5AU46_9BILA
MNRDEVDVSTAVRHSDSFSKLKQNSPLDKNSLLDDIRPLENKTNEDSKLGKPAAGPLGMASVTDIKTSDILSVKGVTVPDCAKGCTMELFATFDVAFRSGSNFKRFGDICELVSSLVSSLFYFYCFSSLSDDVIVLDIVLLCFPQFSLENYTELTADLILCFSRFNETVVCLADLSHCATYEIFDTLSSGIRYMCIEQREAFTAIIDCIDANAADIKESQKCNAQGIVTGWAVYAALRNAQLITPRVGKIPSKFNVDFFRKMASEACGVLQCYLGCLRSKYNGRCYGVAGSLLSEVLVRPLVESSNSMTLSPLADLAKLVLPKECGYLTTPSALWSLRIDKKLDDDLKRAYTRTKKVKEFRYYLPNSTVVTNEKPNPFTRDLIEKGTSPLDDGFDRDDLWRSSISRESK